MNLVFTCFSVLFCLFVLFFLYEAWIIYRYKEIARLGALSADLWTISLRLFAASMSFVAEGKEAEACGTAIKADEAKASAMEAEKLMRKYMAKTMRYDYTTYFMGRGNHVDR